MEIYKTKGIKYAGLNFQLLPFIYQMLNQLQGIEKVLDGFIDSTRVSQAFAIMSYSTTSNDISC